MNWRLSILFVFLALFVGAELRAVPGVAGSKGQPHAVLMLDDDLADRADSGAAPETFPSFDLLIGWSEPSWKISLGVADMILPPAGTERPVLCSGLRRHRWLCVERC